MADATVTQAAGKTGDPSVRSASAATMKDRVTLMRDIYGGTLSMRAAADTYLPKYPGESQSAYDTRLASTFCLNKLREAVDAASAKPFKTLVGLLNNTDPNLDLWVKDADLQGNHLHLFAHRFFNEAMLVGQSHVLVDFPTTQNLPNLGAQNAAGVRPYLKHIKEDDVRAVYSEYVGGAVQVTHARIASSRTVRNADFSESVINQIWVLEVMVGQQQGIVQLWEQPATSSGGQWNFVSETPLTLPKVPLVTMYAGEKEADFVSRPIFLDLALKQQEHWISTSDQRSILSVARFPMLAASGVELDPEDEKGFVIGPRQVLYSPEAAGRWYFVEPKATAIAAGAADLAALELQMDMMALNPVQQTHRQYVPQNERDIQETRVHSVIHDMALSCRKAMEQAIQLMGLWTNKDYSQVSVMLDSDFTNTSDKGAQITLLLNAFEKGAISPQAWLTEAANLDFLSDEVDMVAELAFVQARAQMLMLAETQKQTGTTGESAASTKGAVNDNQSAAANTNTPKPDFPAGQLRPTKEI